MDLNVNRFVIFEKRLDLFKIYVQKHNMFGVVVILLLNIMILFSVVGGALLDISYTVFQRVCVVPVILVCI